MQFAQILNDTIAWMHRGFDSLTSVQGIIIALVAVALMRSYSQIVFWTVLATAIHEFVTVGWRYLAYNQLAFPNYADQDVWKLIAIRFLGYFIMISILYLARRLVLRG